MKRDMDLIRDILLKVEADPGMDGSRFICYDATDFEGYPQQEIDYHIDLLFEAGFIDGARSLDPTPSITRLTWQGHEFVDNIRDDTVWNSVKERIKGLQSVALTVVSQLALAEMKRRLHLDK